MKVVEDLKEGNYGIFCKDYMKNRESEKMIKVEVKEILSREGEIEKMVQEAIGK